jgi:uncharacterized membrane protein YhhN
VNATTAVLAVTAAAFAVGDWWAVGRGSRRVEYVCKPAATAALIGVAVTLHGAPTATRVSFLVALVLCLVGDVCLMLPADAGGQDGFVPGLAAFLLAHVAFTVGFVARGVASDRLVLGAALIVVVAVPLTIRFVGALTRAAHRELVAPVVAYLVAIGAMATAALGAGNGWGIAGAWFFVASDALIAETRFVVSRRAAPVAIMVTYHLALVALVVSLH